ncbi:MAG: lipid kinase MamU [Solirubrobacterales bacterium]
MRLALVVNRSAGTFRRLPVEPTIVDISEALRSAGHTVEVMAVGRRDLAAALSAVAQRADIDGVIAGGGDGTVLTAVLAGLGESKPLGLLPLGTLNLFARDLGLPADPVEAAWRLARAEVAEIDLAEVNGLPFAIWASLGMHPWTVRRRDHLQRKGTSRWQAMALAALRAFRRYPMVTATLSVRGETLTVTTPLLVISNNAWREESLPLSREALDKGELVVHVAMVRTRLGLLQLAFNALMGRWKTSRYLHTYVADEVRVTSKKRRLMLSLDGEVTVMRSPLVFRLRPKALKVLMPMHEAP